MIIKTENPSDNYDYYDNSNIFPKFYHYLIIP